MEIITHDIDIGKPIRLLCLADLHLGDAHSDIKTIKSYIDMVKESDDIFVILDGDLMDDAIVASKGDSYAAVLTPQEQLDTCVELFSGIKDRILVVLPGNHEERSYKVTGLQMCKIFAAQLGVPYAPNSALLFIKTGKNSRGRKISYTVYVNHGNGGGGKRVSTKAAPLEDLGKIVVADLFFHSHTHTPIAFRKKMIIPNCQNQTISYKEQLYVNTCSFLDWSGSYGDRLGMPPSSKIPPIVTLDDHELKATVTM